MPSWLVDYGFPIAGAVLAGALIGFEREYRGRPAGFRTHILVCLASSLLMLAAVHQVEWMMAEAHPDLIRIDPVRMAHGILTGIGFLCGGVIFRDGFSVHGLTTAASLWITSALGTLYGVGSYGLAIAGTLTTLLVLAALRLIDDRLPALTLVDVSVRYRRAEAPREADFRQQLEGLRFRVGRVRHRLIDGGETLELSASLKGRSRDCVARFADILTADPRVVEFEVNPRD
ncbi:MAG: MgtC/SapB family protein [Phenylobacterium sp.]